MGSGPSLSGSGGDRQITEALEEPKTELGWAGLGCLSVQAKAEGKERREEKRSEDGVVGHGQRAEGQRGRQAGSRCRKGIARSLIFC